MGEREQAILPNISEQSCCGKICRLLANAGYGGGSNSQEDFRSLTKLLLD